MTRDPDDVLADLAGLRAADPPTHGGSVLSYVYDAGRPDLDELVSKAVAAFLPVNGLDPTTFGSVAVLERDLVAFGRSITGDAPEVVGSVTSGGTESCLLAVKTARDLWLRDHPGGNAPTLVLPTTGHAAFRKAAQYLGLRIAEVSIDPATGWAPASGVLGAVEEASTALVVLSAPCYPYGVVDPVAEVAPACHALGVPVHVDACVGGFVLPFLSSTRSLPAPSRWDFSVPGVASISLDLHKYGYAPKGASLLLHRGRERHLAQYFASTAWPGYPVVNPTMLGSRSATALAAAWAVTQVLGVDGYRELTAQLDAAWGRLRDAADAIEGLRIVGKPVPGLLAIARADGDRKGGVDPFLLVDEVRRRGFLLQSQPGLVQPDGTRLPRTAHLTVTPVTSTRVDELIAALVGAADAVRGQAPPVPDHGLVAQVAADGLPDELAVVMATLEALPPAVAEPALAGVLQSLVDPGRTTGPRPARPADIDEICAALPDTVLGTSWGDRPTWKVPSGPKGKGFVLYRPPDKTAVDPDTGELWDDLVVIRTPSAEAKQALVEAADLPFFTIDHFNGYNAVLVRLSRLGEMTRDELAEVITEAWLTMAPRRLARAYQPVIDQVARSGSPA